MQRAPALSTAAAAPGFVALLAAMTALGPMSIDMYLPSIGHIAQDLGITIESVQPTVAIFFIGLAFGQLIYGPLSDRLGRRPPLLFGIALFIAGSVGCGAAQDLSVLLAGRLAQALGACACLVVGRAAVRDCLDLRGSARFFSLLALVAGLAPIFAPLVGAGLLELFGWRGIFGTLALFAIVLWLWVWRGLAETRSVETAEQARQEHPLRSYVILLSKPQFLGYLGAGTFNGAAMFTYVASSPTVLIDVYGLSPAQFGLLFGLNSVGLVGASQLNRWFLRKHSVESVLRGVTVVCIIVAASLSLAAMSGIGGLRGLAVPLFFAVSTVSLIQANAMAGVLAVDPTRAGSTAALYGAGSFAAGALFAWLSGLLYDHTARPMSMIIAACFVGCSVALILALRTDGTQRREAVVAKQR